MHRIEQDILTRIRFVMVETTHTGNIGAVARAMKTMGLSRIDLVRPKHLPDADAVARASGADDLLQNARIHDDLTSALEGCRLVIGSSARLRTVEWPLLEPADCAKRLLDESRDGDVALLLGRESSGLTNDELARCHYLVHVPTNPQFSSLNVAAAAQIFAYEIRCQVRRETGRQLPSEDRDLAPAEDVEGFYQHLFLTLDELGFSDPEQSHRLHRRLRRLFNRARLDRMEINILRGILSAARGKKGANRIHKGAEV